MYEVDNADLELYQAEPDTDGDNWLDEGFDNEDSEQDVGEEQQEDTQEQAEIDEGNSDEDSPEKQDDISQTKAFSEALNRARKNDKEALDSEIRKNQEIINLINQVGKHLKYQGDSPEELLQAMVADARNISVDELKAEEDAINTQVQERIKNDPEYINFQQQRYIASLQALEVSDLNEIKNSFSDIKAETISDIPNFEKFFRARYLIQQNSDGSETIIGEKNSVKDAFIIANFNELSKQKADVAKRVALNTRTKDHLKTTSGNVGESDVPEEIIREYVKMGYSREEAIKDYNSMKG